MVFDDSGYGFAVYLCGPGSRGVNPLEHFDDGCILNIARSAEALDLKYH